MSKLRTMLGALTLAFSVSGIAATADDLERAEYFVSVKWLDTVPVSAAFKEVGLFGNQNSACQPQTPKWRHTVERLKTSFKHWDDANADSGLLPP